VLRLEADAIDAAGEDFSLWSTEPLPVQQPLEPRALREPQGPRSGLAAVIGHWPGDESDDEVAERLRELS